MHKIGKGCAEKDALPTPVPSHPAYQLWTIATVVLGLIALTPSTFTNPGVSGGDITQSANILWRK